MIDRWGPLLARAVTANDVLFTSPGWAHDIGNSLQAASLHLEALRFKLGGAGDAGAEDASAVALREQLDRIQDLVAAWVQATVVLSPEPFTFDLRRLVTDVTRLLEVTLRHRGIVLQASLPESALPVSGDRFALLHTCLSLLANAIDAMPEGGQLGVCCGIGETGCARVRISDTGSGIPAQSAHRIFEAGYTERAGHLGLGLTFSLQTIERHSGRLGFVNGPHGGATVWFELPLATGSSNPAVGSSNRV